MALILDALGLSANLVDVKTSFILSIIICMLLGSANAQSGANLNNNLKFAEDRNVKSFTGSAVNYLKLPEFTSLKPANHIPGYVFSLKEHTAKGAVFCRMENLYREKFDIWIKIHAGVW